jgi:hypothetical protein
VEEYGKTRKATNDNIIGRMWYAFWIANDSDTITVLRLIIVPLKGWKSSNIWEQI